MDKNINNTENIKHFRNSKPVIEFADVNFWMGENYISSRHSVNDKTAKAAILHNSERKNIKTVFISNFISLYYSSSRGNDITAEFIKKNALKDIKIYGTMFFEQQSFYEPDNFSSEIKKRYMQGFRLLRLLPKSQKYPYEKELFKYFYQILNEFKFPLILSIDEADITDNKNIEWSKILDIAKSYENIPIILDGGDSKELMYNSYLLCLIKNAPNIYLEAHNLLGFNQIEDLAEFAGAEKIVFGSYYPFLNPGISISRIINSGLDMDEIQKITFKNIEKIINNISLY